VFVLPKPVPPFEDELVPLLTVFDVGVVVVGVVLPWVVVAPWSPAALAEPAALPLPVFTTTLVALTFWAWLVELLLFWLVLLLVIVVTGFELDELELEELELELDEDEPLPVELLLFDGNMFMLNGKPFTPEIDELEVSAARALENPAVIIKNATDAIPITFVFFCII
jgi:hypothetical protein